VQHPEKIGQLRYGGPWPLTIAGKAAVLRRLPNPSNRLLTPQFPYSIVIVYENPKRQKPPTVVEKTHDEVTGVQKRRVAYGRLAET
jgi:hypothetical protein